MLLCLACVPALVLVYVGAVRARAERAARLASEGLVQATSGRQAHWQRHVPFALFATAIALVCFALARPTVSLALPQREGTVILAFDVSNSMRAKDLQPTRIDAAKAAASAFAKRQPGSIRIGVVAFGDSGVTVLRSTNVKADVIAAIEHLSVGGGTSLAQGLLQSLSAIAGKKLTINAAALASDAGSVKIGFFGSSAIVLLSDGENTSGLDPLSLAEVASTAGVHIHTVGIGTKEGTVVQIDGFSVATALDENLLKKIAQVTDGTYHQAGDAQTLAQIYNSIHLELRSVEKPREATALFASAGGLLLVLGSVLSLVWFGRVI
jgi:Ca-activated chloride channel family protein